MLVSVNLSSLDRIVKLVGVNQGFAPDLKNDDFALTDEAIKCCSTDA
jgi:hypothetical protein